MERLEENYKKEYTRSGKTKSKTQQEGEKRTDSVCVRFSVSGDAMSASKTDICMTQ